MHHTAPASWQVAPSSAPPACASAVNWRQDTWSDLQLFVTLNLVVFLAGAWIEVGAGAGTLACISPGSLPLPAGAMLADCLAPYCPHASMSTVRPCCRTYMTMCCWFALRLYRTAAPGGLHPCRPAARQNEGVHVLSCCTKACMCFLAAQGTIIQSLDGSVKPPPEGAGVVQQVWYSLYKVLAVVLG